MRPVLGDSVFLCPVDAAKYRTQACSGLEQLRCFAADHLEVSGLVYVGVMAVHELHYLAFGDHIGSVGQDLQHAHVVRRYHHLKRARIHEVAHEDGRSVAEQSIGRGLSAPQLGLVDDIIMQQRRSMNKLDHRSELMMKPAAIAKGACRQYYEGG